MWEYKTTVIDLELLEVPPSHLDELGMKGWSAYAAFPKFPHSSQIIVMLKRKIKPKGVDI